KLKNAKILLIGAGGLGSPLSLYLAASGIGTLGLIDFDKVEFSNLQRQVIHPTKNIGRLKLDSAKEGILRINPNINVELYPVKLSSENALDILDKYEIVIDGTDNFPTRYLVNGACVLLGKPNIYGSIFRFEGQASVFDISQGGPCYRCLYPSPPPPGMVPSCAEGGVLGILPGIVGIIQATEAVKLVLQQGVSLAGRLLLFNALEMKFRELNLRKDPSCPLCGENKTITSLVDYEQFCGTAGPENKDQSLEGSMEEISVSELKEKFDRGDSFLLLDVREPHEYEISKIPGSKLIPLGTLRDRIDELSGYKEIVVHCKSGMRSAKGIKILSEANITNLKNLTGGILAWADEIDPDMPKY
ncbi:MAG: ThiF family adenylyltransferase, partial [Nitrospinota bacterium]